MLFLAVVPGLEIVLENHTDMVLFWCDNQKPIGKRVAVFIMNVLQKMDLNDQSLPKVY